MLHWFGSLENVIFVPDDETYRVLVGRECRGKKLYPHYLLYGGREYGIVPAFMMAQLAGRWSPYLILIPKGDSVDHAADTGPKHSPNDVPYKYTQKVFKF